MSETFFTYQRSRWFWVNLCVVAGLTLLYIIDSPIGGRNGSTWLGYSYGFIAAAGIAYLMWYGVRKRSYHSSNTTLRGVLSGHVWVGVALAIIVPLHAGFHFGCNIHTAAYVLMMIVVISGVYGAINYVRLAPLIAAHRGGGHTSQLLEQISRLTREIDQACRNKSDGFAQLASAGDFEVSPSMWKALQRKLVPVLPADMLAQRLAKLPEHEHEDGVKLVALIQRKRDIAIRLQSDVRTLALLKVWLWVHLPVSLALVVCVIIHILVVFMYR